MRRIIEILKMFQNNPKFVSLTYLVKKFSLTIRTLQRDIARINRLLASVSNCKIIKSKDKLVIVGSEPKIAIDKLLRKILKVSDYNPSVKWYQLIFYQIWEDQPLTNNKLFNFTNGVFYDLKQEVNSINNCLNYYDLNLKLKFKTKQGWVLEGSESDLRLLATKVLISEVNSPLHPNNYLDTSLVHLQNQVATILLNNQFYNSFTKEILWFLVIIIKRIKLNRLLNSSLQPLLLEMLLNDRVITNNFIKLSSILEAQFSLKFDYYETVYLKSVMLLNQKNFSNDFLANLILSINNFVSRLLIKEYQLLLTIKEFKMTLSEFLKENLLKLLFNFYQDFKLENVNNHYYLLNASYWYGWEILNIIVFVLKKFDINVKFRFLVDDYFLMIFNNFYLESNNKNWVVSLYYQFDNKFSQQNKKVILFIENNYKNIISKSINIDNIYYKKNFLNKNYAILVDHQFDNILLPSRKLVLINNSQSNQQLRQNLDFVLKNMLIDKIRSSILVFQFFFRQRFSGIKNCLAYLQEALIRKFKLNSINLQLKDGFINSNYLLNKILIIHKLVTKTNVVLPIILIYLKHPLTFHKKFPINFIFISINSSDTLYKYQGLVSYIDIAKTNFTPPVHSIKGLYQIINNNIKT